MRKLIVLCGISIFGIVGSYYYYLKIKERDKNDDSSSSSSKNKSSNAIEFVLSNEQVPLVIGRNGIIVKNIEEKTNTKINFREKDESTHYCVIEGAAEDVKRATQLVNFEASRPPIVTDEILVPAEKVNMLSGDAVTEIINKTTNVKIWIDSQSKKPLMKDFRRVLVTGTKDQVNAAKKLIEKTLEDEETVEQQKSEEQEPPKREPRQPSPSLNTSTSSIHTTESPRDILPTSEKLRANSQDGQLEIYVSAIYSPSKFYVQIVGPQSADLDILVDQMTAYYNDPKNQQLHHLRNPYLGQIVAAKFNFDNKWYRAEVNAIQPNEFSPNEIVIDLYFVDYGDTQFVKTEDIFELRTDFLSLRFQAIECFLANVQPVNTTSKLDEWNEKTIEKFEELTHVAQWVKLNAKLVTYKERKNVTMPGRSQRESSPVPGVEIYDYNNNGTDINIAEELVNHGLAEFSQFGDLQKSSVLKMQDNIVDKKEKENEESDSKVEVGESKPTEKTETKNEEVQISKEKTPEPVTVQIDPPTPEEISQSLPQPEEKSKSSEETIVESEDEVPEKPEESIETNKKEESAELPDTKPQNGTHSSPELPGTSMNGSHNKNKKANKNKSNMVSDFISNERSAVTDPSPSDKQQFGNKKINKKSPFKGQDWNEML